MATDHGQRVGIAEAAAQLNLSKDTVRRRIRRGELDAVRDNAGQWRVLLPMGTVVVPKQRSHGHADWQAVPMHAPMQAYVDALVQQVADLQRRLDAAGAERARLIELVERLTAERTSPERRPWPGLRLWWRRMWEGEG